MEESRYKMDTEEGEKVCLLPADYRPRKGDYNKVKDKWYRVTRVSPKTLRCLCRPSGKPY